MSPWTTYLHNRRNTSRLDKSELNGFKTPTRQLNSLRAINSISIKVASRIEEPQKTYTIYTGYKQLLAINPNGTLKWSFDFDEDEYILYDYVVPSVGKDGTIYVGTHRASGTRHFYALNPDGTLKWKFATNNDIITTAAIADDGTIYFGDRDGYFYALNPDGTLKWKMLLDYLPNHPVIGPDGTIYFGCEDGSFYALNPDMTVKWKIEVDGYIALNTPAIADDGTIYFGCDWGYFDPPHLYALNPDGTLKWKIDLNSNFNAESCYVSPTIGNDGTIYLGIDTWDTKYGPVVALNPDGTVKWTYATNSWWVGDIAIGSDGTLYFKDADLYLYALNPDGTLKWRIRIAESSSEAVDPNSPSIGPDGTIYSTTFYDGYLYAFNPDGTLKWKYSISPEPVYLPPTIA